jgi:hypothetical protein
MSDPLALSNFVATLLVFGAPVVSVLIENRRFRGDRKRRWSDPTYWELEVSQIAGLVLGVLLAKQVPAAALPGNEWLWPVLGCAVGLIGIALRWWAIRTLGAHFTRNLQVVADQQLVIDNRIGFTPVVHGRDPHVCRGRRRLGNVLSLATCVVFPVIGFVRRIPVEASETTAGRATPSTQPHSPLAGVW